MMSEYSGPRCGLLCYSLRRYLKAATHLRLLKLVESPAQSWAGVAICWEPSMQIGHLSGLYEHMSRHMLTPRPALVAGQHVERSPWAPKSPLRD